MVLYASSAQNLRFEVFQRHEEQIMDESYEEFKHYLKLFSSRLVQTLVQARLGDDIKQPCLPAPADEWFNMKIDELGEVAAHLKSCLKIDPKFGFRNLTVEFVLYTSAGRLLPLEAWTLSLDTRIKDPQVDIRSEVYEQLCTLLRSVSVASRMTPMHRLYVKKQDSENFVILYRVFETEMILNMGKDSKSKKIAKLSSPFGLLSLDLVHRTQMHFEDIEYEETVELENTLTQEKLPEKDSFKEEEENLQNLQISLKNEPKMDSSSSSEDTDDERPSLAELGNQPIPFVSLLQSAYSPIVKTKRNRDISRISTHVEVKEEDEEGNLATSDSFEDLLHLSYFASSNSPRNELGELLQQLKIAPEIFQTTRYGVNMENYLREEINQLGVHKEQFQAFINHINSIQDDD